MAYSHNANDLTPVMTSHNTPSPYVISASAEYTSYLAWKAFDHQVVSGSDWYDGGAGLPAWLKIDCGSALWIVTSYDIWAYEGNAGIVPTVFKFQGSNNNSTWVDLDSVNTSSYYGSVYHGSFSNTTAYRYYRVYITNTSGGSATAIGELELFGALAPTTNIKTVNGLAIASVKTINGLAIASVKNICGLA